MVYRLSKPMMLVATTVVLAMIISLGITGKALAESKYEIARKLLQEMGFEEMFQPVVSDEDAKTLAMELFPGTNLTLKEEHTLFLTIKEIVWEQAREEHYDLMARRFTKDFTQRELEIMYEGVCAKNQGRPPNLDPEEEKQIEEKIHRLFAATVAEEETSSLQGREKFDYKLKFDKQFQANIAEEVLKRIPSDLRAKLTQ